MHTQSPIAQPHRGTASLQRVANPLEDEPRCSNNHKSKQSGANHVAFFLLIVVSSCFYRLTKNFTNQQQQLSTISVISINKITDPNADSNPSQQLTSSSFSLLREYTASNHTTTSSNLFDPNHSASQRNNEQQHSFDNHPTPQTTQPRQWLCKT